MELNNINETEKSFDADAGSIQDLGELENVRLKYLGNRLLSFGVSRSCAGLFSISFILLHKYLKNTRMLAVFRAKVAGLLW